MSKKRFIRRIKVLNHFRQEGLKQSRRAIVSLSLTEISVTPCKHLKPSYNQSLKARSNTSFLFSRDLNSWDKKEWEVLWNDLSDLCKTDKPRTHFIGSIVTMPTISVPEGVTKYLLIDGQQRLTTIFILLSFLRDRAEENGDKELSEEITNTLLVNPYKKDSDYYKLLPTQIDRVPFQNLIKFRKLCDQDQLSKAYIFFRRKFQQSDIEIQTLKKVISNNLSVVSVVLGVDDDPHLVFESLNAKGRPLTQSDLIRNFFFMRIHMNEQEDIHARYWMPMQNSLATSLTEYIRHFLMKDGSWVKESDVYFSLKINRLVIKRH